MLAWAWIKPNPLPPVPPATCMEELIPKLDGILARYAPISLPEMDGVRLLRRRDTKYLMTEAEMLAALGDLTQDYRVLEIEGLRFSRYETVYFDHPALELYMAHHRGKINRHKVRIRTYVDSGLAFLEVKLKRKGATDKRRLQVRQLHSELTAGERQFITDQGVDAQSLSPSLRNTFARVTLVEPTLGERLTFDFGLTVSSPSNGGEAPQAWRGVCIAELKQSGINRLSPFARWAKARQIRPQRISKYCLGLLDLRKGLKGNRFLPKQRKLDNLIQHAV